MCADGFWFRWKAQSERGPVLRINGAEPFKEMVFYELAFTNAMGLFRQPNNLAKKRRGGIKFGHG
jgi:hypothetical protein